MLVCSRFCGLHACMQQLVRRLACSNHAELVRRLACSSHAELVCPCAVPKDTLIELMLERSYDDKAGIGMPDL
jgi:histidinol phosphatase-like enzyme